MILRERASLFDWLRCNHELSYHRKTLHYESNWHRNHRWWLGFLLSRVPPNSLPSNDDGGASFSLGTSYPWLLRRERILPSKGCYRSNSTMYLLSYQQQPYLRYPQQAFSQGHFDTFLCEPLRQAQNTEVVALEVSVLTLFCFIGLQKKSSES